MVTAYPICCHTIKPTTTNPDMWHGIPLFKILVVFISGTCRESAAWTQLVYKCCMGMSVLFTLKLLRNMCVF